MRIGIDLLPFGDELGGTGRYAENLIQRLGAIDHENSYFLYLTKSAIKHFNVSGSNFNLVVCPLPSGRRTLRILWEQIVLPIQLFLNRIDLLFVPSVVQPLWAPCKTVSTIHDLIPFRIGKKYPPLRTFYVKLMTILSAKLAHFIITVSHTSKQDLIDIVKIPASKVFVIYQGVDEKFGDFQPGITSSKVLGFLPSEDRYILFVGALEPGKNIPRLVHAFETVRRDYSCKLVLAGGKGWCYDGILDTISKSEFKSDIVLTGYVDTETLQSLYHKAVLFAYPSLYEGFGLPVLEAMACRIPVITSDVSSLPEVVDGAALLVNPYNVQGIAAAMSEVIKDSQLRASLITKGSKRVKEFSWTKTAENTLKVFQMVSGRK